MNKLNNKLPIIKKYKQEVVPTLMKELNIKNILAVPKIEKIVLNVGLGEALSNKAAIENVSKQLSIISGQKPKVTVSKRSISTFKLRAGMPIGLKVTLRGKRMFSFFTKLVTIVLPRVRDFRGVSSKSFDGKGNYSLGFSEQTIFPEISFEQIDKIRGLEITIVTNTKNNKQAYRLLELMGIPFAKS